MTARSCLLYFYYKRRITVCQAFYELNEKASEKRNGTKPSLVLPKSASNRFPCQKTQFRFLARPLHQKRPPFLVIKEHCRFVTSTFAAIIFLFEKFKLLRCRSSSHKSELLWVPILLFSARRKAAILRLM